MASVRTRKLFLAIILAMIVVVVGGCFSTRLDPEEVKIIYDRAAAHRHPGRNPVIVIPGMSGSRLVDEASNRVVWGAFGGSSASPKDEGDMRLIALPLRSTDPPTTVRPDGVLESIDVFLAGVPIELKIYYDILVSLGLGGYRDEAMSRSGAIDYGDEHFTCFQFDYDWRLSVDSNAERLHTFMLAKGKMVKEQTQKHFGVDLEHVRFDIVTHSMGGLLTRYYLRYGAQQLPTNGSLPSLDWRGANHVERAILIGPPNAGTAKAVQQLVDGLRYVPKLPPRYEPALLGTFESGYQLLPRTRHAAVVDAADPELVIDMFDLELWAEVGLGLLAADQDHVRRALLPDVDDYDQRWRIARDRLSELLAKAEQLQRAIDIPAAPPKGTQLYLITGDSEPTDSRLSLNRRTGEVKVVEQKPGDVSVLRSSALMDERVGGPWQPELLSPVTWEDVIFMPGRHFRITRSAQFTDNLLYRLLEEPRYRPSHLIATPSPEDGDSAAEGGLR